jgi:hypothetical protein
MIKPSIGRIVWFHPANHASEQQCAAIITYVHEDNLINIAAFSPEGAYEAFQNVYLVQDEELPPASSSYAQWMPYQKAVAK